MIANKMFRAIRYFRLLCIDSVGDLINSHSFKSYVLTQGKVSIIGRFHIYIDKTAKMTVGKNFNLVSSHLINPLCTHPSSISVGDGAVVCIGDNVGMSSPTIWIRKSLIVGNNVNFGGDCEKTLRD